MIFNFLYLLNIKVIKTDNFDFSKVSNYSNQELIYIFKNSLIFRFINIKNERFIHFYFSHFINKGLFRRFYLGFIRSLKHTGIHFLAKTWCNS